MPALKTKPWAAPRRKDFSESGQQRLFTHHPEVGFVYTPPVASGQQVPKRALRIYVASKTCHAPMWRDLRELGYNIISTWIDEAGAGESSSLGQLSARCIDESARCDRFVLFCQGDEILKGALMECGAALAAGVPVYSVGKCPSFSEVFASHPHWHVSSTLSEALGPLGRETGPTVDSPLVFLDSGR